MDFCCWQQIRQRFLITLLACDTDKPANPTKDLSQQRTRKRW